MEDILEKKTLFLLFILAVVIILSINAGNKYNVDPADYEVPVTPVEETPTEEVEPEPVEGLAITFDSDYVYVEQYSEYDLKVGMTVHDDNDSEEELANSVTMDANPVFDINEVGVYEITYEVTNSVGETATATRTFEVVPEGTEIPSSES